MIWVAFLAMAMQGLAQTVVWSDGFETNASSRWQATAPWKIGAPTAGPAVNASGYRTHSGANCAYTQGYGYNKDVRLICNRFNGAGALVVPPADQVPMLRFWQWFNFGNALGYVEVSTNGGADWIQISPTYLDKIGGGVWSRYAIDLSGFAGESILLAFHFTSGGCCGNGLGWFVDDVEVDVDRPLLALPEGFESDPKTSGWSVDTGTWEIGRPTSGPGSAHSGTNCAGTVLGGAYLNNVDTRLISPPLVLPSGTVALRFWQWYSFNNALGYVEINNGTVVSGSSTNVTITTNVTTTLNTNTYQLFGALVPGYTNAFTWNPTIRAWTNGVKALGNVTNFDSQLQSDGLLWGVNYFVAGQAPFAFVGTAGDDDYFATTNPVPQSAAATNYLAWQGMTWLSVINFSDSPVGYFGTNYAYTYTTNTTVVTSSSSWIQVSPTFQNAVSGGWTNTTLDLSAYAGQAIQLGFHFSSGGFNTAAGWYVDDITLAIPPVLTAPGNQVVNAGDLLVVTNAVSDPFLANPAYVFKLLTKPAGMTIDSQGVVTWQTSAAQPSGTNAVTVVVTDNNTPPMSATNSFVVTVVNQSIPDLIVPPTQKIFAGQTLVVTNSATNAFFPDDTFTFQLLSPTGNMTNLDLSDFAADGVMTWPTLINQKAGTYTNIVMVTDDVTTLSATNRFLIVVSNPPPPTLSVPLRQLVYAGQTLTVTNKAASVYGASSALTFALLSGLTNSAAGLDDSGLAANGVLTWVTGTNLALGNYTNKITVRDSLSGLSATNSFVVAVTNHPPPPTLFVPVKQTIFPGLTLTVTNTAVSVFGPNTTLTFAMLSGLTGPASGLDASGLATQGILAWATQTNLAAGNYTNKITVKDSLSGLSATNSFVISVSNVPPPTLTVPPKQAIYVGQALTVTNTAASIYGTNTTFTFALLSGLTNAAAGLDLSGFTNNGVLSWSTMTNLAAANYTNRVAVQDSRSGLFATNSFVMVVSNVPPPALITLPPKLSIYGGQTWTVTNSASSLYSNSVFTFQLFVGPNSVDISTNGLLRWMTTAALPAGNSTNLVTVVDSISHLSSTNRFIVVVLSNTPTPPTLIVPPAQTIYAGQTLTVTNSATNSVYPDCTFTFGLLPPVLAGASLDTNTGVLTWPTTIAQPVGAYTNFLTVSDSASLLTATNQFEVRVLPPQPPTLIVPPTQLIYAGQPLIVTNFAASVYPGSTFTFAAFGPTNLDLSGLQTGGVIKWTPAAAQAPSSSIIYVQATDNRSLQSLSNFLVLVVAPPAPVFAAPAIQRGFATNGFRFTLSAQPRTTWRIDASTNLLNWSPVFTNLADPGGSLQVTDFPATNFLQRYYRAVLP